ncbi:hypothetical protein P4U03_20035 [Bacillus mycoides]|uniref:hypothetical protein n=1 Tax=Bacillus cereus group TaxID=86661 RepID=UPI001120BCE9|nr:MULTISPECIES: hypothetical protein [Bacillus cereus group]MED1268839.1 hypothetical protein [Bacillus mycoides]
MSNLKLQSEVLLLSSYCKILNELFHVQRELTLPKTIVYTYLIKKEDVENFKIYNAKNTKDLMYKSLSILAGDEYFFYELKYIIMAIDLLVKNDILHFGNGILYVLEDKYSSGEFESNTFLIKAIKESEKISDKQFLKEVLSSV